MIYTVAFPFLLQGITFATLIDTIGSVASRKLNFDYAWLIPISLLNYLTVGYCASDAQGLRTALVASFVVGLYDATIGVWLALRLKANYRFDAEDENVASHPVMTLILIGVALIFGFIGHLIV